MDKQKMIVAVTICLHNFIRENNANDKDLRKCDQNSDYVSTVPSRYRRHHMTQNAGDTSTSESDDRTMDKFRDDIARAIFLSRSSCTCMFGSMVDGFVRNNTAIFVNMIYLYILLS
jgi:hypothetical protein